MEQVTESPTLSSGYLCKRCTFFSGLVGDLVNCGAAKGLVSPITKKQVPQYVKCPYRNQPFIQGVLEPAKLKELAAFARDKSHTHEDVAQFEASLRNQQQMTG